MVIKIEGRVDGFFLLSEFFKIIFYIRFHEIKIDRDMPFVFYIIGQQKQIPVALKLENTLGFFWTLEWPTLQNFPLGSVLELKFGILSHQIIIYTMRG